jgi:CheY-like chemotaxis protein
VETRPSSSPRPTVLVVDDEEGVRVSFQFLLDDHYEVVTAADGHAATATLLGEGCAGPLGPRTCSPAAPGRHATRAGATGAQGRVQCAQFSVQASEVPA